MTWLSPYRRAANFGDRRVLPEKRERVGKASGDLRRVGGAGIDFRNLVPRIIIDLCISAQILRVSTMWRKSV